MLAIFKMAFPLLAISCIFAFPNPNDATEQDLIDWSARHRNPFSFLELPRTASEQEIDKAYRKYALQWHPDKFRNGGKVSEKARTMFIKRINAARADAEKWHAQGNVFLFHPGTGHGTGNIDFDFMIARGRFKEVFDLVVPMPFNMSLTWDNYMRNYVINPITTTQKMQEGGLLFIQYASRLANWDEKEFEKEVGLSVALFKPKLRQMLDEVVKSPDASEGLSPEEAKAALIPRGYDLDSDIKSTAVPMFGGLMNGLLGKILRRMAWTRNPGFSAVYTLHHSLRLAYVNSFKPNMKRFTQVPSKYLKMMSKYAKAARAGDIQKAVNLWDNYIWTYVSILVEPVIRKAAQDILYGKGVTRSQGKKLAKAMKLLAAKFLKNKQIVSDDAARSKAFKIEVFPGPAV